MKCFGFLACGWFVVGHARLAMSSEYFVTFKSHCALQALDLKPNYVRAWSNMGIGYANQVLFSSYYFKDFLVLIIIIITAK